MILMRIYSNTLLIIMLLRLEYDFLCHVCVICQIIMLKDYARKTYNCHPLAIEHEIFFFVFCLTKTKIVFIRHCKFTNTEHNIYAYLLTGVISSLLWNLIDWKNQQHSLFFIRIRVHSEKTTHSALFITRMIG